MLAGDEHYEPLMKACSALRVALTEDLESRQQRSLLLSIELGWRHTRQSLGARLRLWRLRGRQRPTHGHRFRLAP